MARFLSLIFVWVLLRSVRIKAYDRQGLDINKGILASGNSEDMMLEVDENSESFTIESSSTLGPLEDITDMHPESSKGYELWKTTESFTASSPPSSNSSNLDKSISNNSTTIDTTSSSVNTTTNQGFLTSQYSTEDNDTATLDYSISSQGINVSDTLYPLMELSTISPQSMPQHPQEPITNTLFEANLPPKNVILNQENDDTRTLQKEYHKRQENSIYKSTEETTAFQSFSLEEFFSFNESYSVNKTIGAFKTLHNDDSSQYPKISTNKPQQKSINLLSMSKYPSESTNNNKKSMHPYLLMSLEEKVPDYSLSSSVRNDSSSNSSISPSLRKISVTIQNQNATIEPLIQNMNTILGDQSLKYSKASSDYFTSITGSNNRSESIEFVKENDSVSLQDLPETTESLSLHRLKPWETNQQNESSSHSKEIDKSNQIKKRHITPLSEDFMEPFTFANETTLYHTPESSSRVMTEILDYSPSPANVDIDTNNLIQEINTERETENITTLYTETPSVYSTDPYEGTTLNYHDSSDAGYYYSESANEAGPSENTFWFESPLASQARLTFQREDNNMPTTEMMDPVITKMEISESQEQIHKIDTSDSISYHSENPGTHLIDIMINKTTEKRPQHLTSSLIDLVYIYSKGGLEISTVVKSNNQTKKMYLLNKNITYYNSIPKHTSNVSNINVYQAPNKAPENIFTEHDLYNSSEQDNNRSATIPNETLSLSDDISATYTSQTLIDSLDEPLSSPFSSKEGAGISTYTKKQTYETLGNGFYKTMTESSPKYAKQRTKMSNYEEFRLSRESENKSDKDNSVREMISINKESIYLYPLSSPEDIMLEEALSSREVTTSDRSNSTPIAKGTATKLRSGYSTPNHTEATPVSSSENLTKITESNGHSNIRYYMIKDITNINKTLVNMNTRESSKNILFEVDPSSRKNISINERRIIAKSITMDNSKRFEDDTIRNLEIIKYSERKRYDIGTFNTESTNEMLPEFLTDISLEKSRAVTNSDSITFTSAVYKPHLGSTLNATERPEPDFTFEPTLPSNDKKPYGQDVKVLEDIRTKGDNSKNINMNYIFPTFVIHKSPNPYLEHFKNNFKKFPTSLISKKYNSNFFPQIKCLPQRLFRQNGYVYLWGQKKCYYPYLYPRTGYKPNPYYQQSSMYKF